MSFDCFHFGLQMSLTGEHAFVTFWLRVEAFSSDLPVRERNQCNGEDGNEPFYRGCNCRDARGQR